MYQFFVNHEQIEACKIKIVGEDVNHIKNAIRLSKGEEIYVLDKDENQKFLCKVVDLSNEMVECDIIEKVQETTEARTYLHIFQGLPKADKLEWIIEKTTEIGVKEITPMAMQRSIVKLNEKEKIKKLERWNKIAEVAAKQSKRDQILIVNPVINFKNLVENLQEYDIVLVAYEKEKENTLKSVLQSLKNREKTYKIAIVIGPEGGIAEEEIEVLRGQEKVQIVTLGKRVLRTETAPIVMTSNLLYELEE